MSGNAQTLSRSGRSWRDIRQEVTTRAMSRKGRRRQRLEWLKYGFLSVLTAGLAGTAYIAISTWEENPAALAAVVQSEPVRNFTVITDGTLTRRWVEDTLALPRGATLMGLELAGLRDRLVASGQVRTAVVSRSFPDTLVVTLQERTPVARVQVQEGTDAPRQLFVAKDGAVYDGINYDPRMVASLPWLDGVRLTRAGRGYAPVDGMAAVADLLVTAQLQAPNLYREWAVVSLARLETRAEIIVRSRDIGEIVFSRREDFFRQLARLDYIADMVRKLPEPGRIESINLALGGQVPVRLANAPGAGASPAFSPQFTMQPASSQPKGPSDL